VEDGLSRTERQALRAIRRRGAHSPASVHRHARAGGGSVPGRRVVLSSALHAWSGRRAAARDRSRRAAAGAAAAQRRTRVRVALAPRDRSRRTSAPPRGRSRRAARRRSVARRHSRDIGESLAMGLRGASGQAVYDVS
jgi:hypothetical protein